MRLPLLAQHIRPTIESGIVIYSSKEYQLSIKLISNGYVVMFLNILHVKLTN